MNTGFSAACCISILVWYTVKWCLNGARIDKEVYETIRKALPGYARAAPFSNDRLSFFLETIAHLPDVFDQAGITQLFA